MSERFAGRVAVVTGGASGIGLAVAAQIAREGGRVALWDLEQDKLETAQKESEAAFVQAVDVSDEASVEAAHAATVAELGEVDILVTSAGTLGPSGVPVSDLPSEVWRRILDVNLTGTYLCAKAVAASMRDRGYGRIATVASVAGKEGPAGGAGYAASKAGVISLTKSMGKELAPFGVTVNTITPGVTETPMISAAPPPVLEMMKGMIPMARFAAPQEMANLICFMVSEECSYTTGAVFDASGGRTTY